MTKIVVVDSYTVDHGDEHAWDALAALGDVHVYPRTSAAQRVERCRDAVAIVTNKVPVDKVVLEQVPTLRYVGVTATGVNIVDLAGAAERGVAVTNVPAYSTSFVAQHTLALLLHFTNAASHYDQDIKADAWARSEDFCFFSHPLYELAGKTWVVVGYGHIGRAVGELARALGMNVVPAAVPGSSSPSRTPLREALGQADVVSLHCPLTDATRSLVNDEFLAALKPTAVLLNTSRGPLVDEAALVRALDGGHLRGVGLDVLSAEPPAPGHPLLDPTRPWSTKVVVTPHIAWGSPEARARLREECIQNVVAFFRGERRNRLV